jgi:MFS family permease
MSRNTNTRLGPDFAKLWGANTISNVGDGVTVTAGPLLVASFTPDPALVAGALFAQQLPWLLFSLISGVYVDRLDRRRLVVVVNLLRGLVMGGLALAAWNGLATLPLVYSAFFLLGTGATLANNATVALLPAVVPPEALSRANARLGGVQIVANQLLAPPFGAWLFVAAAALPFGFDALTFLLAAALVGMVHQRYAATPVGVRERQTLRADIAEGVRWLWHHRMLRTLALSLCLMNITLFGIMGILVLYAQQRLGLGPLGYGLLLAVMAVGGVVGTATVSRLESRFGAATLLRAGLVVEAATDLSLGITRSGWVAGVILAVFGIHAMVWGVLTVSLRQRVTPARLLGRVNSVYYLFGTGGSAIGALLGGLLARWLGITAPFWLAGIAVTLLTVVAWQLFTPQLLAAAEPASDPRGDAEANDAEANSGPATGIEVR